MSYLLATSTVVKTDQHVALFKTVVTWELRKSGDRSQNSLFCVLCDGQSGVATRGALENKVSKKKRKMKESLLYSQEGVTQGHRGRFGEEVERAGTGGSGG